MKGLAWKQNLVVETAFPESGTDALIARARVNDSLQADNLPSRNLATFVTTGMDEEAHLLALAGLQKNLVNSAEYPQTEQIHQAVIRAVGELFHAPWAEEGLPAAGLTAVGSSEAVMLALIAHQTNWRAQSRARGLGRRPYVIVGTHSHVCFEKFARYFDVGVKFVPLERGQYSISAAQVEALLDSRIADDVAVMDECGLEPETVGNRRFGELVMAVACVVGTTYTGHCDDVEGIALMLGARGWKIPIHVDAASGGFVLPFVDPNHKWDFRVDGVASINVSNHKYGLVYSGLATLIFRSKEIVDPSLWIDVPYLTGPIRSFGLNFTRPSSGVITQYYNLLRLGRAGYRRTMEACLSNAQSVADELEAMRRPSDRSPYFEVISNIVQLPIVTFRLAKSQPFSTLKTLSAQLGREGWVVPVYRLPTANDDDEVMRVVIRADFTAEDGAAFVRDVEKAVRYAPPGIA